MGWGILAFRGSTWGPCGHQIKHESTVQQQGPAIGKRTANRSKE